MSHQATARLAHHKTDTRDSMTVELSESKDRLLSAGARLDSLRGRL